MLASIGSSTSLNLSATLKSTAGLETQIEKYKKQLSDCVNCPSSKTPKGKANIQAISNKITTLTSEVETIAQSKTSSTQWLSNSPATSQINNETLNKPADTVIGSRLNVYA